MKRSKISEFELIGGIGVLTLNNPPQNILDEPDFVELNDLKTWLSADPIKGLIISSKSRHFSAGANKDKIYQDAINFNDFQAKLSKGNELLNFIENLEIPTIACINGACFGGGLEIALCASIRVCSVKSLFSLPETGLGLVPGLGGIERVKRLVGASKAIGFVLSGDIITASDAVELGIADYAVKDKEEFNFALELMNKMTADKDIKVINSVIRSLHNSRKLSFEEAISEEMKMFCRLAYKEAERRAESNE